jgi:lipid A ethanolaminephosphotransferase
MRLPFPSKAISSNALIMLTSVFLAAAGNLTFFAKVLHTYPIASANAAQLISLVLAFIAINAVLFALVCFGRLTKPILILMLLLASLAACFMDSYGVVISDEMLRNAAQTNPAEALDLMTTRLLAYFCLLGLVPAIIVARVPLRSRGWLPELKARAGFLALLAIVIAACIMSFSGFYASFFREHKALRSYANPTYFVYSAGKFANEFLATKSTRPLTVVGADARTPATDDRRELVILVVGETARADRFSINGYGRETSPALQAAQVLSFSNFMACGTSTAVSVPCMFSMFGMEKFDPKKARTQENLLDVLQHAGVNVLWLDNNSDSKGVALRSTYQSYRSPKVNPVCDDECRDEGMLVNLQSYIDAHPSGDIFIVLHQMGNHGPAYFKRYPPHFEKFRPTCKNNDLGMCTDEEIGNAYDNAILYTDYFLGKTIELLKSNDARFETALFYVSDHGESLGENGLYLHGLPRAIAPLNQVHVPAVLWLGGGFRDVDMNILRKKRGLHFTHDSVAHTILGLMEIKTKVYRPELDILDGSRLPR